MILPRVLSPKRSERVVAPAMEAAGFKIVIYEHELNHLAGWVLDSPNRETGGDLLGFWTHSGFPAVQLVIGPGPAARHEVTAFYQDDAYMKRCIQAARDNHGQQQIGEWHSHHRLGLAEPSSGDVRTLMSMFDQYPLDRFLLCIATLRTTPVVASSRNFRVLVDRLRGLDDNGNSGETVELGAFLFRRGHSGFQRGLWVVLPSASPIAESLRATGLPRGAERPLRAWTVPRTTLEQSFEVGHAPPEGWYTKPAAAAFLRDFDAQCRHAFGGCRMLLDNETFCYEFVHETKMWEARFPLDFPEGAIALHRVGEADSYFIVAPLADGDLLIDLSLTNAASDLFQRVISALAQPSSISPPSEAADPVTVGSRLVPADGANAADPLPSLAYDGPRLTAGDIDNAATYGTAAPPVAPVADVGIALRAEGDDASKMHVDQVVAPTLPMPVMHPEDLADRRQKGGKEDVV